MPTSTAESAAPATSPEADRPFALWEPERFVHRHIGPRAEEIQTMLNALGYSSLDELTAAALPAELHTRRPLNLPPARTEAEILRTLTEYARENRVFRSYIGQGYHDCITPPVIQRNILENPGWYTAYTPYQSEISQGRLEALLNFQTMVRDLTGLEIANASLLDEATAAAEAMMMCHRLRGGPNRNRFFVASDCHPQTIAVVRTRARALGFDVIVADPQGSCLDSSFFGVLVQYPATDGTVRDYRTWADHVHAEGALLVAATDLLALTLLPPPGAWGADIAVGSAQRFGVPMFYGGPHAAFLATRDAFKRQMPGRLVGTYRDARGRPALRLALGTREQHIRREKATSNICTAQALLAIVAMAYAAYHGPHGLRRIALRIHSLTRTLAVGLERLGYKVHPSPTASPSTDPAGPPLPFFDTITVHTAPERAERIHQIAAAHRMNFRRVSETVVGLSLDETTTPADVQEIWLVFNNDQPVPFTPASVATPVDETRLRPVDYLQHPVFNRYHSETEMLRYLRRLESRDFSLCQTMIPLGSCTMKLNPTAALQPVTWPEWARLHPFAPVDQARGWHRIMEELKAWLSEITGFPAICLQPNAGSQGEYAGLLVIRAWHQHRGEPHRDVCLIPTSAHGTNPASAAMAGLKVVAVACDRNGNVDVDDLRAKAAAHRDRLACLMITYPSTHGVFEPTIRDLCRIIHDHGGLVYMDGANLNALVGLCRPAELGADVCHLNLHKTFAIPHGGGGPGAGPIGVAEFLRDFLPDHPMAPAEHRSPGSVGPVAAAPWGSAGILLISWAYIAMMGPDGLRRATQVAILNANYIARRLEPCFPTLYKGPNGLVAHECILDLRRFHHITAEDVAKRLMDYGFHAPTLSWPVAGTLMVEPTESESKAELDRFCDAMTAIHAEILEVETGRMDPRDNPLKNAPHTADMVAADPWPHPYSRQQAAWPLPNLLDHKWWPAVARVDNVYGDRHPVCACGSVSDFATAS
ncbi:aminomethyl-transferring glycine dehydrogenase [Limisphaera ngatamarikiensis]|uniref:Glycine dehydrogenase (decarboxylating) n=1 Tax=Limisphaera ngatamarikiensis TaxID=1324935 RepID=A0A6M1RZU5_9BACT|nr:aminomethyl-transferring glycine dehydrogenase [Limisphaera ngatamarikiensis]NGO40272.1 aminomethyl-transferring glycine dehydrogenase [Limisphaera ngatamarikiensis]